MRIERHKSLISVFLLMLLMSYKVGVTMFVHTHDVDGTMVVHSHPFTSSSHSHSASQVVVIGQLSSFSGVETTPYEDIKIYGSRVEGVNICKSDSNVITASVTCLSLRAPPVCC